MLAYSKSNHACVELYLCGVFRAMFFVPLFGKVQIVLVPAVNVDEKQTKIYEIDRLFQRLWFSVVFDKIFDC